MLQPASPLLIFLFSPSFLLMLIHPDGDERKDEDEDAVRLAFLDFKPPEDDYTTGEDDVLFVNILSFFS